MLTRLFEFQRELFRKDPEREDSKSEEIAAALKLSPEQTEVLGELVWLGRFGGGRGGEKGGWSMSAMDEAPSFPPTGELSAQVEEWALKFYRPTGPVFQDQHSPPSGESLSAFLGAAPTPQPQVSEIAVSLERLREKYPDPKKIGFLIMRFTAKQPFRRIVNVIKTTAEKHGLAIIRADNEQFHHDLWGNVRTLLHGCGFGIAVYERIDTNEPNANVGLEVGYLMAMNKPVLLLKDSTVPELQSDLAGKLYHSFEPHDPKHTIPDQLTKWLETNGIIVPKRP